MRVAIVGAAGADALVLRAIPGRAPRSLVDHFRELAAEPEQAHR